MKYAKWFLATKIGDHAFILTKENKIYEVEIIQFRCWNYEFYKMVAKETPEIPFGHGSQTPSRCDDVRVQLVESGIVICVFQNFLFPSKKEIHEWPIPESMKLDLSLVLQ